MALIVIIVLLSPMAAGFVWWQTAGGAAWLGDVKVLGVDRSPTDDTVLLVSVSSCNSFPRTTNYAIDGSSLRVGFEAFSTPTSGGEDCSDVVEVGLGESGVDVVQEVVDTTTGTVFAIGP